MNCCQSNSAGFLCLTDKRRPVLNARFKNQLAKGSAQLALKLADRWINAKTSINAIFGLSSIFVVTPEICLSGFALVEDLHPDLSGIVSSLKSSFCSPACILFLMFSGFN